MRLVTKQSILAFKQVTVTQTLFHKFEIPKGACLGFSETIEGHEREIYSNGNSVNVIRCFWLKGGSTTVIYITRIDRSNLIGQIMWDIALGIYEGFMQFADLMAIKEEFNGETSTKDLWPSNIWR